MQDKIIEVPAAKITEKTLNLKKLVELHEKINVIDEEKIRNLQKEIQTLRETIGHINQNRMNDITELEKLCQSSDIPDDKTGEYLTVHNHRHYLIKVTKNNIDISTPKSINLI